MIQADNWQQTGSILSKAPSDLRRKTSGRAISQSWVGSSICCQVMLKEGELSTAIVVADVAVQHDEMRWSYVCGIVLTRAA